MTICHTCRRPYESSCTECHGTGKVVLDFSCECCECGRARSLYDVEGIIRVHPDGTMLTNQTGGVCCHHPRVRGFFTTMAVPKVIRRRLYDRAFVGDDDLEFINEYFRRIGFPFEVTGGEEAWLEMKDADGNDYVLTWANSD